MSDALVKSDMLKAAVIAISEVLAESTSELPVLAQAAVQLYELADLVDELKGAAKQRITERLQSEGKKVTEKGTLRLSDDSGWTFEARPTNTGFDPKRVESLVRAKGLDPRQYMQTVLTFKIDTDGMSRLQKDGHATEDELETCRYPLSYTVMRPVRGSGK